MSGRIVHCEVNWTVTIGLGVGHKSCDWCGLMTPSPSTSEMVEFAQNNPGDNFMWPGDDWMPDGWSKTPEPDPKEGVICQSCTAEVRRAATKRRKQ